MAAIIVTAIVAFVTFFSAGTASAQCANLNITNNTGCTVDITFQDGGGSPRTITGITPGFKTYPFSAAFFPVSILSGKGNTIVYAGGGGCTGCVSLQVSGAPAGTLCCATLCPTPNCGMTINPVVPCPPACP